MASRYSGFGSNGSGPRRGARAAIRANRSASTFRRRNKRTRRSTKAADIVSQTAVGGMSGGFSPRA